MQGQWHTLISKLLFWLMVEIILNLVGLDNVADYSEFLLGDRTISIPTPQQVISLPL
ncbi:MAG: hypothetical protein AAF050_17075 [Cyanobacteria bacterium J06649_5]